MDGRLRSISCRLRRKQPDQTVPELILVDRSRSAIGPTVRRFDLPLLFVIRYDATGTPLLVGRVTDHTATRQSKSVQRSAPPQMPPRVP